MTARRVICVRDPRTKVERLLAVMALLVTTLAPAASQPAEIAGDSPVSSATLGPAASAPAAGCDAQSMLPDAGLAGATEAACVASDLESDQAYLVETARPGRTMLHQGTALAIVRLHPMFVRRLADAIGEARAAGLPAAGIFSAYRPPAFGVGRFSDKFNSLHTYGLAVDMLGIGGPGSSEAKLWYEIAARHGIVCPYGAGNRREWNHCQPTRVKSIMAGDPLRGTVSPPGPIDLEAMFAMGDALVNGTDADAGSPELPPTIDEKSSSHNQEQPPPQTAAAPRASVGEADPTHARHRPVKTVAGPASNPSLHEAHGRLLHETHGQPQRRAIAQNASAKSGPPKKYRIASLVRHDSTDLSPASPNKNARAKQIDAENARVARSIKGICRGC